MESFENGNGQSPELVQASELLKQAREKEKEGDLVRPQERDTVFSRVYSRTGQPHASRPCRTGHLQGGAEEDLNDAIDTLKSTPGAKRLLSAGFFARGRHWVRPPPLFFTVFCFASYVRRSA